MSGLSVQWQSDPVGGPASRFSIGETGSSLFSVGWEAQFGGDEVEHGDEIGGGAISAGLAFGGGEDAVERFHEGIGGAVLPVSEDAGEMTLDHLGTLEHGPEEKARLLGRNAAHPAAPGQQFAFGQSFGRELLDVLQGQPHLVGFGGEQVLVFDPLAFAAVFGGVVLRVLAQHPAGFLEGFALCRTG